MFWTPINYITQFWTSFYEQTAQVRIPIYEDYSSYHDQAEEDNAETNDPSHTNEQPETSVSTTTENSFMPGQGAFSSTPALSSRHGDFDTLQSAEQQSWSASMESPLVRLDREIRSLDEEDQAANAANVTAKSIQQNEKGKGRAHEPPEPLLRGVLKQQAASAHNAGYSPSPRKHVPYIRNGVSPLKLKPKPKTPVVDKSRNPYIPSNSKPSNWNGIVDLSDPSMSPARQVYRGTPKAKTPQASFGYDDDSLDDSSVDIVPGMSPPVTMQLARAPRSSVGLGLIPKLGRTPKSSAAERIRHDIIHHLEGKGSSSHRLQYGDSGVKSNSSRAGVVTESSMSSVPSPPSLSRYARHGYPTTDSEHTDTIDSSLQSMMRRVGLTNPAGSGASGNPLFESDELHTPNYQAQGNDSDSSSDSMDDPQPGQPSAAFLMAAQNQAGMDDSFGSSENSSDSFDDDPGEGGPHPAFAQMVPGDDDDSFDDDLDRGGAEEETLFGVPPQQRLQSQASTSRNLHLHGEDLLQDTMGLSQHRVEESPTPWGSQRG